MDATGLLRMKNCYPKNGRRQTGKFTATCCQQQAPMKEVICCCNNPKKTASYSTPMCVPPRGPCCNSCGPCCSPCNKSCIPPSCNPPYSTSCNCNCNCCCPPPPPVPAIFPSCNCCGPCCCPTGPLDDEENFMESLMPFIRCMSKIKKMQLRVLFQNILFELMVDTFDCACNPLMSPYKPSKPICTQDEDEIFFWGLIPHLKSLNPENRLLARKQFFDNLYEVYTTKDVYKEKTCDIYFENLNNRRKLKRVCNMKYISSKIEHEVMDDLQNVPVSATTTEKEIHEETAEETT